MTAPVGPLATEAARLLDVLAERLAALRDTGPAGDGPETARAATGPGGQPAGQGPCPQCGHDPAASTACTACPLCRLLALLRGERPESTARLVDGALTVVQLLRGLLPAGPEPAPAHAHQPGQQSGQEEAREPAAEQTPAQRSPSPQQPADPDGRSSRDTAAPEQAESPGLVRIDIR